MISNVLWRCVAQKGTTGLGADSYGGCSGVTMQSQACDPELNRAPKWIRRLTSSIVFPDFKMFERQPFEGKTVWA